MYRSPHTARIFIWLITSLFILTAVASGAKAVDRSPNQGPYVGVFFARFDWGTNEVWFVEEESESSVVYDENGIGVRAGYRFSPYVSMGFDATLFANLFPKYPRPIFEGTESGGYAMVSLLARLPLPPLALYGGLGVGAIKVPASYGSEIRAYPGVQLGGIVSLGNRVAAFLDFKYLWGSLPDAPGYDLEVRSAGAGLEIQLGQRC